MTTDPNSRKAVKENHFQSIFSVLNHVSCLTCEENICSKSKIRLEHLISASIKNDEIMFKKQVRKIMRTVSGKQLKKN